MNLFHPRPENAESLYVKHAPALLSICLRYCGNRADAEDVLHEGFIKILKNLSGFKAKNNGTLEAWMKRIMVNTSLNYLRDHARERRFLDIDSYSERIPGDKEDDSWFEELSGRIDPEEVMEMICELPSGYRTVFNMYVLESYTHKEIAEFLGCTENTSKSQLSKARALLRRRLDESYQLHLEMYEKEGRKSG
jgi:RNA polymerase sigma-70 factor, ECF subfamily